MLYLGAIWAWDPFGALAQLHPGPIGLVGPGAHWALWPRLARDTLGLPEEEEEEEDGDAAGEAAGAQLAHVYVRFQYVCLLCFCSALSTMFAFFNGVCPQLCLP